MKCSHRCCPVRRRTKRTSPGGAPWGTQNSLKNHKISGSIFGTILDPFWAHFRSILAHFWDRISDRFSRCVFKHFLIDLDVHLGSILASKTTPGGTPTRKGRPSILNNPPMKIKLFDPVGVAGGSRGRHLKPNTFYEGIRRPKCLQNDPKMVPKTAQNSIKK